MLSRQCRKWGFKKLLKTAQFEGYFCAWSGSAIIAAITVGDIYPDNSWGDGRHATQVQAVRIALVSAFRLIKGGLGQFCGNRQETSSADRVVSSVMLVAMTVEPEIVVHHSLSPSFTKVDYVKEKHPVGRVVDRRQDYILQNQESCAGGWL
jgi:hypothetical protein